MTTEIRRVLKSRVQAVCVAAVLSMSAFAQPVRMSVERAAALRADAGTMQADADPRRIAKARLRLLIAELLAGGGRVSPECWLIGATLDRGLTDLDAAIDRLTDAPGPIVFFTADLSAARAALADVNADAWSVVRDGLAVLTRAEARESDTASGWLLERPAPRDPAAALATELDRLGLTSTPEVASALELLTSALADPAYALAARALAEQIRAIAQGQPPRGPVAAAVRESLAKLAQSSRDVGPSFQSQGAWSVVLAAAQRASARGQIIEQLRAEVAQRMPREGITPVDVVLWRGLIDLAAEPVIDESQVPRPMRPLLKALGPAEVQTRERLVAVLPEAIRNGTAPTDPGVLAAIAGRRALLADLSLVTRAAAVMAPADDEPRAADAREINPAWQRLVPRLQRLAQDLPRPERTMAVLAEMRSLLAPVIELERKPAEVHLARAVAEPTNAPLRQGWDALTGGRTAALRADMLRRREACLDAVRRGVPIPDADAEALEAAGTLVAILADAAWIAAPQRPPAVEALNHLAAWEVSESARQRLVAGLAKRSIAATRLILEGDPAAARAAAELLRDDAAPARVMGRLTRAAEERGATATVPILAEVAAGGPRAGAHWLATRAADLATLSAEIESATAWPIGEAGLSAAAKILTTSELEIR